MATLGPGAACCGDPETCPLGVCDEAAPAPADLPSLADLHDLDELFPELDDDEEEA